MTPIEGVRRRGTRRGVGLAGPETSPAAALPGAPGGPVAEGVSGRIITALACTLIGPGQFTSIEVSLVPDGRHEEPVPVTFTPERMLVSVPAANRYSVATVAIDGWPSDEWDFGDLLPDATGLGRLRVHLPVCPTLEVVGEESAAPIERPLARSCIHPARPAPFISRPTGTLEDGIIEVPGADGRIRLPRTATRATWWIGGPGRAWRRVAVRPTAEAQAVALRLGGDLVVGVEGASPGGSISAHLIGPGSEEAKAYLGEEPAWDINALEADGGTPVHLAGLLPGLWGVRMRGVDDLHAEGCEVRGILVGEGATARATCTMRVGSPAPAQAVAEVSGRVWIPSEWGGHEPGGLTLRHLGSHAWYCVLLTNRVAPQTWQFGVPEMAPGTYLVSVGTFGWERVILVRAGASTLDLVVPPPVPLRVAVLEGVSGRPLSAAAARVAHGLGIPGSPEFQDFGSSSGLARESADGDFVGLVPQGPGKVIASAEGYVDGEREFDAVSGTSGGVRLVVRLERAAEIRVEVRVGEQVRERAQGEVLVRSEQEDWEYSEPICGGIALIPGLSAGRYDLHITWRNSEAGGGSRVQRRVDVKAGESILVVAAE